MKNSADQRRDHDPHVQTPSLPSHEGGASKEKTQYEVGAVEAAKALPAAPIKAAAAIRAPEKTREKKVAVFVAHGMGQQIPFQTLDQVATGLLKRQDEHGSPPGGKFKIRAVKFNDQWLHRIELKLRSGNADPVEAHVYEGYWAPLTEGKITARGIIGFLGGAGRNGIVVGSRDFCRYLFGEYRSFGPRIRTVLYLLIALATVAALVAMNSTIAVVSAGRALLAQTPAWLSDALFADLTTTFNAVITAMAVFGVSLGLAYALRRLRAPTVVRQVWGWLTVLLFIALLFVIVLAALSLAFLFYGHVKWKTTGSQQLWYQLFPPTQVDRFNAGFDTWALRLAIVAGALLLLWWIVTIARGVLRDLMRGRWLTLILTACVVALAGLAVRLGFAFVDIFSGLSIEVVRGGLAWVLLVAVSAYVRRSLIQYLGDVAIYVTPYKLDAFFQVRDQIKECVYKVAYAVYAQQRQDGSGPEYDEVFVVGHSLGSVIVYDVLNRLVNEDEAIGCSLKVVARTPLLLTFGSPLDKTAFLFAEQRQNTGEAREALAAAVQPLIQDYCFRPKCWINIYSPWDIISGSLDFYDPPGSHPKRVRNKKDLDATTLLAAHVEYWRNPLLFETLYQALSLPGPIECDTLGCTPNSVPSGGNIYGVLARHGKSGDTGLGR